MPHNARWRDALSARMGAHVKKEREPKPPRVGGIMWTGGRRKGATAGYAGPERRQG